MCSIFQIQIDPLMIITETWKALSRPIGYLKDPQNQITRLIGAKDQLQAQSEDYKIRIKQAEHDGEVPTNQFQHRLKKVDEFIAQASKIIDDHTKGRLRWGINRRVAHILVDIKAFSENHELDVLTIVLPPKSVQEVLTEQPIVTMDTYLSQLEIALKDDESRIIGIWGMGGVGKTTLLSSLKNNLGKSQQIFDYIIWVVVSRDYNFEKLQRDIANRLGLPVCEDRVIQANKIMDFLKNKSFLLLLDDLWDLINLVELGIPHPSRSGTMKHKVVFTTRLENICGKMQAHPTIKIKCLNKAESWQLFKEKVGDETLKANPRIPPLAQQVAEECDGLPLSLVLIGSAMSTKKAPREWHDAINQLKKSTPHEIHGMDDKIFSNLKFSYDYLADDILRQCFLLCSLWPEDHRIRKTNLIECWIGYGLVDEHKFDTINEAYDRGYSLIGALQSSCLLEPCYDEERSVKMHDVVRDLALWIASDCGKKPNRFVFLSIDTSFVPPNCSELEMLIVRGYNSFKSIVPRLFEGTLTLTYLDLSHTRSIEKWLKEICQLVNLRYLNLSSTLINSLPSELGNLHELRFLILTRLNYINLDWGALEKLEKLSVIDITDSFCNNWQQISRLRCNLKGLGISLESIEDLHHLAQLSNVQTWRLELRKLRGLNKQLNLLSAFHLGSPKIRSSIETLTIDDSDSLEVLSMESDKGHGIQKWCLSRLEELRLTWLQKLQTITWQRVRPAEMLPSLTSLLILGCHNLSNCSWVIRLPSLENLTVRSCNNMQQIIEDDYNEFTHSDVGPTFPSLRSLELDNLKSLIKFGGSYAFPSLELFKTIKCPKMKTLPFGEDITRMKLKSIEGWRDWWEELNMEDNVRAILQPYFKETYF